MSNYEIFDSFFDYQVKLMCAGIEATMTKKESLYTCALALSTYTEIMGGLVTGNLKKSTEARRNYEAFLPYLGEKYDELNNHIKTQYQNKLKNLYTAIRSKLVHEFALRESHAIWIYENAHEDRIGIELISNKIEIAEIHHINFHIPEYYRDFRNGITKYYNELKDCRNHDVFDRVILSNFLKATVNNFQS